MMRGRHLDWDGCCNVRDLGGLPVAGGGETRWGAVIRADSLELLTAAGWAALEAHGVRTLVDLRNDDERHADRAPRPAGIETVHLPLDGLEEDPEFWEPWVSGPQFGTPLYYRPHLDRFPERSARVIAAVANAAPGGVVIHCRGGRDRAGQITMLLLALAGVAPEDIAADYALSSGRIPALFAALGQESDVERIEAYLESEGTTAREVMIDTLAALDVEAHLRAAGLTPNDVVALRARLVSSAPAV